MNKNTLLLWQGQLVSQLGTQAYTIVMMVWLMNATGSSGIMGLLMMLSVLPSVLLGPLAGVFVDNMSRLRIIIISDIFRGLTALFIAALIYFVPNEKTLIIVSLAVVAVVNGTVRAFFKPAISATIPDLVPPAGVIKVNALLQATTQVSMIFGRAVGGILLSVLGAPILLLLNTVSYFLSALSESLITLDKGKTTDETVKTTASEPPKPTWAEATVKFKADFAQGFNFVKGVPGMLGMMILSGTVNFFISPFMLFMPFYATEHLGKDVSWYGYLLAAMGVGTILGSGLSAVLRVKAENRPKALLLSVFILSLCFVGMGFSTIAVLSLFIMTVGGGCMGLFNLQSMTLFQTTPPAALRGRVMSFLIAFTSGAIPLGLLLGGIFGELTNNNVQTLFYLCGFFAALCTLYFSTRSDIKGFMASEPDILKH